MQTSKKFKTPKLYLAPMEGVGNSTFRKAITTIGGFDEACTEFIRVPKNAHVKSLAKVYNAKETAPIPQAAQIMGSDPELMADMTEELLKRGAPRIDLNCGCPSNTVVGRGAGSSLLKTPDLLYQIAHKMVQRSDRPVSVKLRSGYEDTSLFEENLLAAESSGASFITLHPRTKKEGYTPPANWGLIKRAKELLSIPVVGNGDIRSLEDARKMIEETHCDALMIGRGAVINPWIFHEIRGTKKASWKATESYLRFFVDNLPQEMRLRNKINQCKQLLGFLFQHNAHLQELRLSILKMTPLTPLDFIQTILPIYKKGLNYE